MENRKIEFRSKTCNLHISAYPGHFATKHSHVNYFLDMTTLKIRQSNAEEAVFQDAPPFPKQFPHILLSALLAYRELHLINSNIQLPL